MAKINTVERISYAGGLYGLFFGSSKGKLAAKIMDMNSQGWNLHLIHQEQLNLAWYLKRCNNQSFLLSCGFISIS